MYEIEGLLIGGVRRTWKQFAADRILESTPFIPELAQIITEYVDYPENKYRWEQRDEISVEEAFLQACLEADIFWIWTPFRLESILMRPDFPTQKWIQEHCGEEDLRKHLYVSFRLRLH